MIYCWDNPQWRYNLRWKTRRGGKTSRIKLGWGWRLTKQLDWRGRKWCSRIINVNEILEIASNPEIRSKWLKYIWIDSRGGREDN